jgi:hypothetical protein
MLDFHFALILHQAAGGEALHCNWLPGRGRRLGLVGLGLHGHFALIRMIRICIIRHPCRKCKRFLALAYSTGKRTWRESRRKKSPPKRAQAG